MKENRLHRRDALKVFGSIGASILGSRFSRQRFPSLTGVQNGHAPNFVIMVFDTLSARHMSLYGYPRRTTPNIEEFAKSSTVYHRHYSASNFTQSATASLLTGVHPWSHRSLEFFESLLPAYETANVFGLLPSSYETLAYTHNIHTESILEQFIMDIRLLKPIEDLVLFQESKLEQLFENDKLIGGYASKRWLQNFFPPSYSLFLNPLLTIRSAFAYSQIQNEYRDRFPMGLSQRDGYLFNLEDAIDWIIAVTAEASTPFFGYFHLLPPHEDYKPRADFFDLFANDGFALTQKPEHFFSARISQADQQANCQRYDEYIAYVDAELGRLTRELEARGILENTYLILTSDHGQLIERGMHGHLEPALYESVIHVPLIIRAPGQTQGMNSHSPTSSLDLVPTLLQLAGGQPDPGTEGRLLPLLGGTDDPDRVVLSMHARRNAKMAPLRTVTFAAVQWPFKLIHYRGYDGLEDYAELFDLEEDPDELNNLAQQNPSMVLRLKEELRIQQTNAEQVSLKR
jgi:arylsulfatase A-like enzyme